LSAYRTVVFVNGCFWHGHDSCRYATIPATNTAFWEAKINGNRERDDVAMDVDVKQSVSET
jgi:DNA mismatch endonuclease (patch repair protein)